jgi:peroxiredoxin
MRTALAVLLCASALVAADENSNRRAPGWALPDSKLQVYDLADYRGKIVVLEFMKTDCPYCAAFADILQQVQQKYAGQVQIIAVANSSHDNQNTVAQYIAGHKVSYPVLFDASQMQYSYMRTMLFDNPHVFLIDGTGFIRHDYGYGPLTRDVFEGKGLFTAIDAMLKK